MIRRISLFINDNVEGKTNAVKRKSPTSERKPGLCLARARSQLIIPPNLIALGYCSTNILFHDKLNIVYHDDRKWSHCS